MSKRFFSILIVIVCALALTIPVTQTQAACSSGTGKPATIYFINGSATDVNIFWNNFDCKEKKYASLAGMQSMATFYPMEGTYDGHEWIVRDNAGNELIRIKGKEGKTEYLFMSDAGLDGGVTSFSVEEDYFTSYDQAMTAGYALLWTRNLHMAYHAFSMAMTFDPSAAQPYAARAEAMLLSAGTYYDWAIADAQAALKMDPNSAYAYGVLAAAQYRSGDKKEGLANAVKAVEIAPDDFNGYYWKAFVLRLDKQYDEALKTINIAIDRFGNGYFYYGRALIAADMGKYEQAISDYTEAYNQDPNTAASLYFRGLAQQNLGNYEAALADYNAFIEAGSGWSQAYQQRGWASWKLGNIDSALADYETARTIDSNEPGQYFDAGVIYSDGLKDYPKALAYYDKELTLSPKDAKVYNNRGYMYLLMKNYDKAVADFDQAIELDPKYTRAYYNRFTAMVKKGNQAEAKTSYCTYLQVGGKATKEGTAFLDKAGAC